MSKESKIILLIAAVVAVGIVGLITFVNSNQMDPAAIMQRIAPENSRTTGEGQVQLVEFGDYQCPACAQSHPTVERLLEEFDGELTFVYRHFPLPGHPNARPAAEAAEAAGAQGKYWEMHALLFENQGQWSMAGDPTDIFVTYAEQLDLDTERFREDVSSRAHKDAIDAGQSDGYAVGVTGTPTFFINGEVHRQLDYESLKAAIEAELK